MLTDLNDRIRQFVPGMPLPWLKGLVILALIAGGALLGYQNSTMLMLAAAGAVAAVPVTLALLRRPEIGVFGIVAVGLMFPFLAQGGLNANVFLVSFLLVLWLIDVLIIQPEIRLPTSRILLPIYILMAISILAFAMGQYPWFRFVQAAPLDAQAGGFATYLLSFGALVLVAYHVKTLGMLERITWFFVVLGSIYALGVALPIVRVGVQSVFGTTGSVFWIWLIAIAYSQALFNRDLKVSRRGLLLLVVAVTLVTLFVFRFKDKSGWVPIILVIWAITVLWTWKLGIVLTGGGLIAIAIILPTILETETYSLATRLELLPILWQITQANPWFGVGFANYYFYSTLFTIRGWSVEINSHNNYVDIFAQTGFIGLVAFIWFVAAAVGTAFQLLRRVPDGFAKAYVNGAIGGLAGMLLAAVLGDWILPFVYNIGLKGFRVSVIGWVFLGGLVVLENLYLKRLPEETVEKPV
ncbi:MAG TPA: O-antigen ligase family protein [Anaerolineales bacterium]|nr:O-antigen ligase family protein [Anaerolineales bacterium]